MPGQDRGRTRVVDAIASPQHRTDAPLAQNLRQAVSAEPTEPNTSAACPARHAASITASRQCAGPSGVRAQAEAAAVVEGAGAVVTGGVVVVTGAVVVVTGGVMTGVRTVGTRADTVGTRVGTGAVVVVHQVIGALAAAGNSLERCVRVTVGACGTLARACPLPWPRLSGGLVSWRGLTA